MKRFFTILLLLIGIKVFADGGSVQGSIQDGAGEPLWGANVYLLTHPPPSRRYQYTCSQTPLSLPDRKTGTYA